jgi:hypothetical protein
MFNWQYLNKYNSNLNKIYIFRTAVKKSVPLEKIIVFRYLFISKIVENGKELILLISLCLKKTISFFNAIITQLQ